MDGADMLGVDDVGGGQISWAAGRVPYVGTEGWGNFFFFSKQDVFASLFFFLLHAWASGVMYERPVQTLALFSSPSGAGGVVYEDPASGH
jgi:hypothetical protein